MMRYTLTSDDEHDPLHRLAVEDDDVSRLITIQDENITSNKTSAQVCGVRGAIDMTREQARWLYFALGKVLTEAGGLDECAVHEDTTLKCVHCHLEQPEGYPVAIRKCSARVGQVCIYDRRASHRASDTRGGSDG